MTMYPPDALLFVDNLGWVSVHEHVVLGMEHEPYKSTNFQPMVIQSGHTRRVLCNDNHAITVFVHDMIN